MKGCRGHDHDHESFDGHSELCLQSRFPDRQKRLTSFSQQPPAAQRLVRGQRKITVRIGRFFDVPFVHFSQC